MKSIVYLFFLYSSTVFSFEGMISCKKIENGIESNFKFYVKGDLIAVISNDSNDHTKILFDRQANILKIIVDDMDPSRRGYYELNKENAIKQNDVEILDQFKLEAKLINGVKCEGIGVKTNQGNASAYFSTLTINLSGFSTFFNDPVYEVIDAAKSDKLPVELRGSSGDSNYVVYLTAEPMILNDSYFQLPSGFKKFEVKAE